MLELICFATIVSFALGYSIGRESAAQERTEEEIRALEQLSEQYRPVIREASQTIDRINMARFQ